MIWTIIVVLIVAAVLFALGWGIGYRVGYRDGDGVWRRQVNPASKGVVTLGRDGKVFRLSDKEQAELNRAINEFDAGNPAKFNK